MAAKKIGILLGNEVKTSVWIAGSASEQVVDDFTFHLIGLGGGT